MDLDMDGYVDPYEEAAAEGDSDDPDEDDSDAESDYEEKSFGLLKSGKHRVRNPDGTFRCPFCLGKKKQGYKIKDLLQHADGIGVSSKHRRHGRERANHRAFARFVRTDPSFAEDLVGITGIQGAITTTPANENYSANGNGKAKANVDTAGSSSVAAKVGPPQEVERFAWPWACVLAAGAGFNAEDYDATTVVGRFLRKHTVLQTIDEVSKTELEKSGEMVAILASQIEEKNRYLQDLETKKNATELSISRLEEDNRKLHEAYNEEMRNLHRRARENALRIFQENENLRIDLENKRRELNLRAKELEKMSAENANDRKTLDDQKQKTKYDNSELELASIEQQRADADVLKLLADQEREKEDVLARMLQLEKELHEKQQLELEVERLNGTLQVMKHLEGDDDGGDIHEKMEKLSERFEREKKRLEDLSGDLVTKERESNDELQQARKELIKGLEEELNGRTAVGIKRMGELDEKPFLNACKRKYGNNEYQVKAAELVTNWQEELKNPSWYPFKMIHVDGEDKEILVDDDTKLKFLWIEFGDDVCNAVKTALMEINEYNPSGRYVVPELWNFRKGRKATMKEVLKYLFSQMDTTTKRRRG
ncbi:Factor of DNA methylation 4 [Zea mays]|uniref:Factor of DNA methylation 4 n=1 Tax=Zea mays TaxID=4577 RepID=A0A1D6MLG7_MAIZE|nr:Factor of DNA methylation 4 [Zea mays]